MPGLRRVALLLCGVLAAPLAGATPAQADPSVELTGFGDFSSASTQLVFDDLGLINGDGVTSVASATLSLGNGDPAKYYDDDYPRESGIDGIGTVSNFLGEARPFPDIDVHFASAVQRVGFEARVNDADEVSVSLLQGGVLVDQVVWPSRGSDMLHFYGLENTAGFDEVQVAVIANASGAFTLDNLTFEGVDSSPPDPDPNPDPGTDPGSGDPGTLVLSCDGFDSFPRGNHGHRLMPVRALFAQLTEADGTPVTDADLVAPPMLRVLFTPDSGGSAIDVTDRVAWRGAEFRFAGRRVQRWFVWMLPWHMQGFGTYMATMESGDPDSYTVDPTCADWTVNPRPAPPHRGWDDDHEHGRHGRR